MDSTNRDEIRKQVLRRLPIPQLLQIAVQSSGRFGDAAVFADAFAALQRRRIPLTWDAFFEEVPA